MTNIIYTIYDEPQKVIYTNGKIFPARYIVKTKKNTLMMVDVAKNGEYNPMFKVAENITNAINYLEVGKI